MYCVDNHKKWSPVVLGLGALLLTLGCSDGQSAADSGGSRADTLPDAGLLAPDAASGLAPGKFLEFEADSKGQIQGSAPLAGGEKFLLLLVSRDTRARKAHAYSARLTGGSNQAMGGYQVPPEPVTAATPAAVRVCDFQQRLRGALASRRPGVELSAATPVGDTPPTKGQQRTFSIRGNSGVTSITAEAIYVDNVVAFWLDRTTRPLASITDSNLKALAEGFSRTIVPRQRTYFGQESDINGDKLISVLFSPLVTESATAYFSPCDLLDPKLVSGCSHSNEMELLYLSPPSSLKPPYNTAAALLETAAHELQHLIYFNRKYLLNNNTSASENPYITEGLSHLAQDLSGYQAGNLYVLWSSLKGVGQLSVPNLGSNEITGYVPAADGLMRGGGYLLLRYLFDQAGGDAVDSTGKPQDRGGIAWLRKFVDSKDLGTDNYVKSSGLKQETLITQFWTAMALSNRGSSGAALSADKRYNFLPISSDPLTSRQRGCNLFTRFHSFQLTGPDSATFDRADGSLLAGGAEFLTLSPASGQQTLSFSISTTPEARALARLIRLK